MKQVLFIIAPEEFRDEELFEPKQILEDAGLLCNIVSTIDGVCKGKLGAQATTTVSLHTLDVAEYGAIVLVGGPGSVTLGDNFLITDILKEAHACHKLIAAICIAPTILAKMGLLKDKRATVHETGLEVFEEHGVSYLNESVVIDTSEKDHVFITANGPLAAIQFGEKILEVLTAPE